MRRLLLTIFLTLFGLGIGLVVGAVLMRRWEQTSARTASRLTPEAVATEAGRTWATVRHRARVVAEVASRAAAEREAELRQRFGVPTIAEAAARARAERDRRGA